ncbi:molybdenum cofactor guanylyltransferase [Paenibacillus sp. 1_12]|uniref:molybdenum cofactor guanylyltransferase n=1 Tax=Paenibacillus sp. 1_12 TaxID=1566278 RepID=UPI00210E66CF|nr:molybdenum cofactor guanylyltransferase [Paenibacillus sp. 1_12]
MEISGVILAGGSNRRMGGSPKAILQLEGKLFIERQLEEMSKLCSEIIIVANQAEYFESFLTGQYWNVRLIRDLHPGKGPLAGLQAAMAEARYEELWVVACDMPFVSAPAAQLMLELRRGTEKDFQIVLPLIAGRLQPLHAIYHRTCKLVIDQLLDAEYYRMMALIEHVGSTVVEESLFIQHEIPPDFTVNVNDQADLEKIQNGLR